MKYLILALLINVSGTVLEKEELSSNEIDSNYVDFTLRNGSVKDIPLLIPGVMNPNLSPMGNSGVSLKVGQKILFKYKAKKRVLLIVDERLEGQVIQVHKVLKKRKVEIDESLKK